MTPDRLTLLAELVREYADEHTHTAGHRAVCHTLAYNVDETAAQERAAIEVVA